MPAPRPAAWSEPSRAARPPEGRPRPRPSGRPGWARRGLVTLMAARVARACFPVPEKGVSCDEAAMARLQPEHHPGLPVFLAWVGQLVTQWFTWANEQQDHNQPLVVRDFLWQFWTTTLENWQSEFLQLLTFVVLTTFLIHATATSPETATIRCSGRWTGSRSGSRRWRRPVRAARPTPAAAAEPGGNGHGEHHCRDPGRAGDHAGGGGPGRRSGLADPPTRRPRLNHRGVASAASLLDHRREP